MTFPVKDWRNGESGGTRLNADALEDLEARLAGYTDQVVSEGGNVDARLDSVESDVAARVPKSRTELHPLDYLAASSPSTDDTTPLQNTITAAAITGNAVTIDRYYRADSGLTLPDNVVLDFRPGGVLDFANVAVNGIFISATGTEAAGVSLTSNAAEAATSVAVAAGAEAAFTVGDYVKIGSSATYDPGRTNTPIGEIGIVASKSSGSITLRSPLAGGAYNTADTAFIAKLTMRQGMAIRGNGIIRGHGTTVQRGLVADRCVGFRVGSGMQFINCQQRSMEFYDCVDAVVEGVHVTGSNNSGSGYGVAFFNACQDCSVANSYFRDCRHATTIGSATTRSGIGRRITIINNHAWDNASDGAAYDTHAACENISFIGNTTYDALGDGGINIECPKATIIGNIIVRPSTYGIYCRNETSYPTEWLISGNRIVSPGQMGIRVSSGATVGAGSLIRSIIVTGNQVYDAASNGIYVVSADTWRMHSAVVANNIVRGAAGTVSILVQKADLCAVTANIVTQTPATASAIRLNDVTKTSLTGNVTEHVTVATGRGLSLTAVTDCTVSGNVIQQPSSASGTGLVLDAASSFCEVGVNNFRGCVTNVALNAGTGHSIVANSVPQGPQTIATNAVFTLTPFVSPEQTVHTGTLTANRVVTLSTTNAYAGAKFRITRTGAGAFTLDVGTGPLKSLATNTWGEFSYDGTAWALVAYGAL